MKRGISLIAVLMFMLAATTASIVVFRWISSENFASGARLKHTEAYKAAESGVEAVQAWLSNKGADVGALAKSSVPVILTHKDNNILGTMSADANKQHFDVYLVGVDRLDSANRLKMKFLSVGKGRDGSEVKLSAIFEVIGLYQALVPGKVEMLPPNTNLNDYDYAYYGGDIKFSGEKNFTSMAVSGDWVGNPPRVDRDFVVTGNLLGDGNDVKVGNAQLGQGLLCVGGTFDPKNKGNVVQDAYWGNAINLGGSFKNVYSNGNMEINYDNTSMENLTLNGRLYFRDGSSRLDVKGNLVIEDNTGAYVDGSNLNNVDFTVYDTVWTENTAGVRAASSKAGRIKFATRGGGKTSAILAFAGARNGPPNYQTAPPPGVSAGYFTSDRTNIVPNSSNKPVTVNAVKDSCDKKWKPVPAGSGCNGSNFKIDDPLAASLDSIKKFTSVTPANVVTCAMGSGTDRNANGRIDWEEYGGIVPVMNGGTSNILNNCFASTSSSRLYGGKYLVVKWRSDPNAYMNSRDAVPLNGKFIFVYDFNPGTFYVYPTMEPATSTDTSRVMLFLEKGTTGEIRSAKCSNNHPYNYFIYSEAEIAEVNEWDKNCPLKGSLYFPSHSCAGLSRVNNDFRAVTNKGLYDELMGIGVLCKRGTDAMGNCTENELKGNPGGGSTSGNLISATYMKEDRYWLPVSPRLKIILKSKNVSREKIPESKPLQAEKSALVIPRIVRLTTDAFNLSNASVKDKSLLSKYYSLLFLNGATDGKVPFNCCRPPWDQSESWDANPCTSDQLDGDLNNGKLPDNTFYRCTFESGGDVKYSDFYVTIRGESGEAKLRLSPHPDKSIDGIGEPDGCEDVKVEASGNPNGFTAVVKVLAIDGNWTLSSQQATNKCIVTSPSNPLSVSSNWNIDCSDKNAFTGGVAATFRICSNNENDQYIKFGIESANGIGIDAFRSESTIKKGIDKLIITKASFSTDDFVRCPNQGNDWLTVRCGNGTIAKGNALLGWECPFVKGHNSVTLVPQNLHESCQEYSKQTFLMAQSYLNTQIDGAGDNRYVSFPLDLEWKHYTVTVDGGVLAFETVNMAIPLSMRTGRGVTFRAYHGETYSITWEGGGRKKATCDLSLMCAPSNPLSLSTVPLQTGTMSPRYDGTIKLENMPNPQVGLCYPGLGKSVTRGTNQNFSFSDIMPLQSVDAFDCGVQTVIYSVNGQQYRYDNGQPYSATAPPPSFSINGTYPVTARLACSDGRTTGEIACGDLIISADAVNKCDFQPSWCNGKYTSPDQVPVRAPDAGGECFFVSSISRFCSTGPNSKINGRDIGQGNISCGSNSGTAPTTTDRRDGGYYVWVDNSMAACTGGQCWSGTAGTPPTSCESDILGVCDFASGWCGNIIFGNVLKNTSNKPSPTNRCVFYPSLGNIEADAGELCINNECKTNSGWNEQSLPPKKDGGYYVYCKQDPCLNSINPDPPQGGFPSPCVPAASGVAHPTCSGVSGSIGVLEDIIPNISCGNGETPTNKVFKVYNTHTGAAVTEGWQATIDGNGIRFTETSGNPRRVELASVKCGNETLQPNIICGSSSGGVGSLLTCIRRGGLRGTVGTPIPKFDQVSNSNNFILRCVTQTSSGTQYTNIDIDNAAVWGNMTPTSEGCFHIKADVVSTSSHCAGSTATCIVPVGSSSTCSSGGPMTCALTSSAPAAVSPGGTINTNAYRVTCESTILSTVTWTPAASGGNITVPTSATGNFVAIVSRTGDPGSSNQCGGISVECPAVPIVSGSGSCTPGTSLTATSGTIAPGCYTYTCPSGSKFQIKGNFGSTGRPLTVTGGCNYSNTLTGNLTANWTELCTTNGSTLQFTNGAQAGINITNFEYGCKEDSPPIIYTASGCSWAGAGQTSFSGQAAPAAPVITCNPSAAVDIFWNIPPPTGALTAVATTTITPTTSIVECNGTLATNGSGIACGTLTVKAAPSISQCSGTTQNVTLPLKPTQPTVTLNDQSNVCSSSGVPNSNWNPIWIVGKGGDITNAIWDNIFTEAGTYTFSSVSGTCGDYPSSLSAITCSGSATVNPAPISCAYQPSWCGGIASANVLTNTTIWPGQNQCAFYSDLQTLGGWFGLQINNSGTACINGSCKTGSGQGWNNANDLPQKQDDGYYVYFGNTVTFGSQNVARVSGSPNCSGSGSSSSSSSGTDYCYGITPTVQASTNVNTTNAVCAKISGNVATYQLSNSLGRTCRINGGIDVSGDGQKTGATATADGHVYIYCSAGTYTYFSMNWW
ncbi:MAG: hypothetical protein FWB90_01465 [Fibromonadales bacterium]|nr:hypothetical protein [Fibromonadales bacterium]